MKLKTMMLALAATAAIPAAANAATYKFSVATADGQGGYKPAYSFRLNSLPVPDAVTDTPGFSFFQINNVTLTPAPGATGVPASPKNLQFYDEITGGAFASSDIEINYFGFALFKGGVNTPQFVTGPFDLYVSSGDIGATLNITAVPEPASWALMIGGFALVGGAVRRRQRVLVTFA